MSSTWLRSSVQNVISRWLWCSACSAHQKPSWCWARWIQYIAKSMITRYAAKLAAGWANRAGKASSSFGGMKPRIRSQPSTPSTSGSSRKKIASGRRPRRTSTV